jgi:hypothetical protein
MSSFEPCAECGNYGHNAPECPTRPTVPAPVIDVKVVISPSLEEQAVILLREIKSELERIRKMLATKIPPPW